MRLHYLLSLLFFSFSVFINAQEISIPSININSSGELIIGYDSELEESALQMNLRLPDGILLDETQIRKGNSIENHIVEWRSLPNNEYLFVIFSVDNYKIQNGDLLLLPLQTSGQTGEYESVCNNIIATNDDEESKTMDVITFNIKVIDPVSIETVEMSDIGNEDVFYDLQGRKLNQSQITQNGIYILNGKKVSIKVSYILK